jgi:hypothetical protein
VRTTSTAPRRSARRPSRSGPCRATAEDAFRVWIEKEDGSRDLALERVGSPTGLDAAWRTARLKLTTWGGQRIRIVFEATDGGADNLVEVGVDDVRVERAS